MPGPTVLISLTESPSVIEPAGKSCDREASMACLLMGESLEEENHRKIKIHCGS